LIAGAGVPLCLFGDLTGEGSVFISAGATLFLAGAVDAGLSLDFAGPASTLDLSGLYIGATATVLSGLTAGAAIDLVDTAVTAASIDATGSAATLQLYLDGTLWNTLALPSGAGVSLAALAVPDLTDGTNILFGPVMPATTPATSAVGTGASMTWLGGDAGQWDDAAAWSGGSAPGSLDSATVDGTADSVTSLAGDGAAGTATFSGVVALGGAFSFGALRAGQTARDALAIGAADSVQAGSVTLEAGALQVAGVGAVLQSNALSVDYGQLCVADSGTVTTGALFVAGGVLRVDATGALAIASPGTSSTPGGAIALGTGGTLSGFGTVRATVLDGGVISAAGGDLAVFAPISGAGSAQIAAGATLFAADGLALAGGVTLAPGGGGGVLELFGGATSCTTVIAGVGSTTAIDIASCTLTRAAWTPPSPDQGGIGVLDLGSAGALELQLAAGMDPQQVSFSLASDGMGGTRISLIPCFRTGTLIATAEGPRPVESLRVGQRVVTLSGGLRPIRWLGRRTYSQAAVREQPQLRPVRILARTLCGGMPDRDLWLSPRHGVILETSCGRRIVPAVALVDGMLAQRCEYYEPVAYVHIGLDVHDAILAEGLAVETYLPHATDAEALFHEEHGKRTPALPPRWPALDCGLSLAGAIGSRAAPKRQAAKSIVRGNLERVICTSSGVRAQGWARHGVDSAGPATVRFYINNTPCGLTIANQWRPDLDNAGLGACGFDSLVVTPLKGGRLSAAVIA
jgi:hypothetical protein